MYVHSRVRCTSVQQAVHFRLLFFSCTFSFLALFLHSFSRSLSCRWVFEGVHPRLLCKGFDKARIKCLEVLDQVRQTVLRTLFFSSSRTTHPRRPSFSSLPCPEQTIRNDHVAVALSLFPRVFLSLSACLTCVWRDVPSVRCLST